MNQERNESMRDIEGAISELCRAQLGKSVARIGFPAGKGKCSVRVYFDGGGSVIATRRRSAARAELECEVLNRLRAAGALVPRVLSFDGRILLQEDLGTRRLSRRLMQPGASAEAEPLLDAALSSLAATHAAAKSADLGSHVVLLDSDDWRRSLLSRPRVLSSFLGVAPPPLPFDRLYDRLRVTQAEFVKWDSRPPNATALRDGRVAWVDWEHCGRRNRLDDLVWFFGDQSFPDDPELEQRLLERHLPSFAEDKSLDDARDYLAAYGALHMCVRIGMFLNEQKAHGFDNWGSVHAYYESNGRRPLDGVLATAHRAARWAAGSPLTRELSVWLHAMWDQMAQAPSTAGINAPADTGGDARAGTGGDARADARDGARKDDRARQQADAQSVVQADSGIDAASVVQPDSGIDPRSDLQPDRRAGALRVDAGQLAAGAGIDDSASTNRMNQMTRLPTIFVQIPSYRDRECQWTVRDLFEKAAHPERIVVAVCWQFDRDSDQDCFEIQSPYPANTIFLNYPIERSKGVGWARRQAQTAFDGEDYMLNIDSHMRFVERWDERMIEELARCEADKPFISTYPAHYSPPDQLSPASGVFVLAAPPFGSHGSLRLTGKIFRNEFTTPRPSAFISGNYLFARSELITEMPCDPYTYLDDEEISMSVRAFTHGWDGFSPLNNLVYHHYYMPTKQPKKALHWNDNKGWGRFGRVSRQRFYFLTCGEEPDDRSEALREIDRYGLGTARTVAEFERFSGIDFSRREVSEMALKGHNSRTLVGDRDVLQHSGGDQAGASRHESNSSLAAATSAATI